MFDFADTLNTNLITNEWNQIKSQLENYTNSNDINNILDSFKKKYCQMDDIRQTVNLFKIELLNSNNIDANILISNVKNHKNILTFDDNILKTRRYFINYHEINDIGVFIGRCQIFHKGHEATFFEILQSCEKMMFVIGSDFENHTTTTLDITNLNIIRKFECPTKKRTLHNLFTTTERINMSLGFLNGNMLSRIYFVPLKDFYDEFMWTNAIINISTEFDTSNIGLFGYVKDNSSYYLSLFPMFISRIVSEPYFSNAENPLSSTGIRTELINNNFINNVNVSNSVTNIVNNIWQNINELEKIELSNK